MNYAFRYRLITCGITCSLFFACANALAAKIHSDGASQVARLEREFKLRAGQQVSVKGTRLRIRFVKVENDSRCPTGVACVWAGNAAVRLWVSTGQGGNTLTLNTNKSPSLADEAQYRGYKLKLVELSPYPRSGRKIVAGSYRATLLVSKE